MSTPELIIKTIPLFSEFDDEERDTLTGMFEVRRVGEGDVLFHFGDPGDCLYVVQSGAVELFIRDHGGSKITLDRCNSEDLFGELSLLDGGARTATAVALEDSTLLVLSRHDLMSFLQKNPSAATRMLAVVVRRVRDTSTLLRQRVTRNANEESGDHRTFSERAADTIAMICGSMTFLLGHVALFAFWLTWNTGLLHRPGTGWLASAPFDPFPFGLLAMAVSVEAILLSTCVLISQRRQGTKDRIRADIEYEVNLKAELEVAHLHDKLDHMHAELLARMQKLSPTIAVQSDGGL